MSVPVDLDELTEAFADASATLNYFVDRETGEVILVSETLGYIEAGLQRAEMAESPDRFIAVPVADLDELTEDLESFVDQLDDEATAESLEELLDTPDPAAALTAYLMKREALAREWSTFRHRQFRGRAEQWAEAHRFQPL